MTTDIAGLILAGGLARRMGGGDKPLITVDGQTLLERTIDRLKPQVGPVLLNANGDPTRFAGYGLDIRADVIDGYGGPLVGILTGLEWAKELGAQWLVSAAADTPLFPDDLTRRLLAAAEGADMAMAVSGGHTHPVFALWPVRLADELRRAVVEHDIRKIEAFTDHFNVARVEWPQAPYDPFFNVNTPEDVVRLKMVLTGTLPAEAPVKASLPVDVVIERKDSRANPWVTETWRPLAVVTDPPPGRSWVQLRQGDGFEHYLAAAPELTLHRSDLASYRYNLGGADPRLFVVVRKTEGTPPVRVMLVTAAPDEAQKWSESGEDQVESLSLPEAVLAWIQTFCASHPPDEPMRKRKRDRLDAERAFSPKEGRP